MEIIDVILYIFLVVFYVVLSYYFFYALFQFPRYKATIMNDEFYSLKQNILGNIESRKNIERLIYFYMGRESVITKKLLDLKPKFYLLWYIIFSISIIAFAIINFIALFLFGFILFAIFTFILMIIAYYRKDSELHGHIQIIYLHYSFIYLSIYFSFMLVGMILSLSEYDFNNMIIDFGIVNSNWYFTLAGYSFNFAFGLLIVTSLTSLLKNEVKLNEIYLNQVKESLENDKTDKVLDYLNKNNQLFEMLKNNYDNSKILKATVNMLTKCLFGFILLGISLMFIGTRYINYSGLPPEYTIDLSVILFYITMTLMLISGINILDLIKGSFDNKKEAENINNNDESTYIWYAGYGSNLSKQRFLCYIKGGIPTYGKKDKEPCENPTPPVDERVLSLPYRLYFALPDGRKETDNWGEGGVAFIYPKKDDAQYTLARAWKITKKQYEDVRKKEGPSWYNLPIYLGEIDGISIMTITHAMIYSNVLKPSESYYKTIAEGLNETYGMKQKEIDEYLSERGGTPNKK